MNYQKSDGVLVISDSEKRLTIVNGVKYQWIKGMKGRSITTLNGKVFIDGFELNKAGEWKRTPKAMWYMIF